MIEAEDYSAAPAPGFWLLRLTRGAVEVPARIFAETCKAEPGNPGNRMERPTFLVAEILGDVVELSEIWERKRRPISAAEYRFQIADFKHAGEWRPDDPKSSPRAPVDLTKLPPLYPARTNV